MRISDWRSDVCSSDLVVDQLRAAVDSVAAEDRDRWSGPDLSARLTALAAAHERLEAELVRLVAQWDGVQAWAGDTACPPARSAEKRVGKGGVSTCRYRGLACPYQKKKITTTMN